MEQWRTSRLIDVHKSFWVVRKAIKRRARVTLMETTGHALWSFYFTRNKSKRIFLFRPCSAHVVSACVHGSLSERREKQQAAGFGLGEKLLKKFGSSGKLLQVNELWFRRQKPRVCCCSASCSAAVPRGERTWSLRGIWEWSWLRCCNDAAKRAREWEKCCWNYIFLEARGWKSSRN